jgi:hypothetical protein
MRWQWRTPAKKYRLTYKYNGLRFTYSQSNLNIQHWKRNTKYKFQEALQNNNVSWEGRHMTIDRSILRQKNYHPSVRSRCIIATRLTYSHAATLHFGCCYCDLIATIIVMTSIGLCIADQILPLKLRDEVYNILCSSRWTRCSWNNKSLVY